MAFTHVYLNIKYLNYLGYGSSFKKVYIDPHVDQSSKYDKNEAKIFLTTNNFNNRKDAGEDGCYTIKDVLMWNPTVMLANGDEGHGVDWLLRTEAVE